VFVRDGASAYLLQYNIQVFLRLRSIIWNISFNNAASYWQYHRDSICDRATLRLARTLFQPYRMSFPFQRRSEKPFLFLSISFRKLGDKVLVLCTSSCCDAHLTARKPSIPLYSVFVCVGSFKFTFILNRNIFPGMKDSFWQMFVKGLLWQCLLCSNIGQISIVKLY